ncbi:MAG: aminotransferase class III-fold pyridoxal phosphate-dependent enzyme, partial [Caldithrix sp.]|nr:aminotransferase class III-fold pyridoxal phosphate-dependent enzyme [Caldithrix sp.]
ARGFTGKSAILKFEGCYHGHGDSFLIKAGSGALTFGEPTSPGVPAGIARETLTADFNNLNSVEEIFKHHGDRLAAVIVEPIAGNMGVIPPEPGFLQALRKICDDYGCILIFDEVMTGFRVHPGGAQALYGVTPDMTAMGKVIGGGMPVGAFGGKKEIMQKVSPAGPIYQAGTLSGNPLAVAAGLKTLEIISRPGFFDNLNKRANTFFDAIQEYIDAKALPLSLNYVNSMGCLYFSKDKVTNFKGATGSDTEQFARYFSNLLHNGVYVAPSQFEAMFISSAHTQDDLDQAMQIMQQALNDIFNR